MRQRAEVAYEAGQYLEAMADYERLVSLYPEEACLHGRLAGCAIREPGRLSLVRRHLRIAIRKGCSDPDLGYYQARLAQLEYDFERAHDLYTAYLVSGGKRARFRLEAERGAVDCAQVGWSPDEAVSLEVFERIPADPEAAFRYYNPDVEGLRLIATPNDLRSKADLKVEQGSMALHDGDTVLVFASLGKKGMQGWDLWKVSVRTGAFSDPISLGPAVNTAYDERDAYLSKDGMLYFSSNRPGGLGGFDLYAVACGLDGMPTGTPYRLPYPINSVNDDVFFIPESDGGAWMASDRASVAGKVHAYRIGIGDGVMATGSVAWSADEVQEEGLNLRVFSGGEEVAADVIDGEGSHLKFDGGESVRIVLEDADGHVVSEAFGEGEGAWELKKGVTGWELVAKAEVAADWAVLSDLQVGSGIARSAGATEVADDSSPALEAGSGWSDWLSERMVTLDEPMADAGEEGAVEDVAGLSEESGPANQVVEAVSGPDAEGPNEEGVIEESLVQGDSVAEEVGERAAEWPVEWNLQDARSLADETPASPVVVEALLEAYPDVVFEVWEEKARQVLSLEREFLDEPDFSRAGELYDLLEQMETWSPEEDRISPRLRDGVALEDIRDMLDEWSRAVQSATKASLARVAGEAALAFRRDRLAARELWDEGGQDITQLKLQWSNWRDTQRGIETEDGIPVELTDEEGEVLFRDWSAVLETSNEVWSKKERSGWRGAWFDREVDYLDRSQVIWEESVNQAGLGTDESEVSPAADGPRDLPPGAVTSGEVDEGGEAQMEGASEEATVDSGDASEGFEVEPAADAADMERVTVEPEGAQFIAVLFPLTPEIVQGDREAEEGRMEKVQEAQSDVELAWVEAVTVSKQVARAWDRLGARLDGEGMPIITSGEDWMRLDKEVRDAHQALLKSTLDELDLQLQLAERERKALMLDWDEREGQVPAELEGLHARAMRADERLRMLESESRVAKGASGFTLLMELKEAMLASGMAWEVWEREWASQIEMSPGGLDLASGEEMETAADQEAGGADVAAVAGSTQVQEDGSGVDGLAEELEVGGADARGADDQEMSPASDDAGGTELERTEESVEEGTREGAGILTDSPETQAVEGEEGEPELADAVASETPSNEGLAVILPGRPVRELERLVAALEKMEASTEQQAKNWSSDEDEMLQAWMERKEIWRDRPSSNSGRAERMAWDKRRFFNERRLRRIAEAIDVDAMERRLLEGEEGVVGDVDLTESEGSLEDVVLETEAPVFPPGSAEVIEADEADEADEAAPVAEADSRQEADAAVFGVILPSAEVVGSSSGSRSRTGLTLRPIEREALERAILSNPSALEVGLVESAESRFDDARGAPVAEGVEYKVQVGAFRKALPAALFAAFDPMWAQRLPNGITRYMAGSFDAYDPAIQARNAIRALGYEDAFVVRFKDGERVTGARPDAPELAAERARTGGGEPSVRPAGRVDDVAGTVGSDPGVAEAEAPARKEDIPTWEGIAGRVYSVQVGAFRGVPDAAALAALGTLTREDAGADGWLRLFSGRFETEQEAQDHKEELKGDGRQDAFIVVYINGRRIPLSAAATTSISPLPRTLDDVQPADPASPSSAGTAGAWHVELGVFTSTIPVRLANAILDAPLDWEIQSMREDGRTRYRTKGTDEDVARTWQAAARAAGFTNARLVRE